MLVAVFFATSLMSLWLALTDHPLPALIAAVAAVVALGRHTMRSGSPSRSNAVAA